PLDLAVERILSGTGAVPYFDRDIQTALPVSLVHTGSVRGALDKIAARTGYIYTTEGEGARVHWSAFETATFTLPAAGGDYSYMIGKRQPDDQEAQQSSGGQQGGIDTSAFDVDRKQFSNVEAAGLNPFVDAEVTLSQIVGAYGQVIPSRS